MEIILHNFSQNIQILIQVENANVQQIIQTTYWFHFDLKTNKAKIILIELNISVTL